MDDAFTDLLQANRDYAESFGLAELKGQARAGIGIVTCMDARLDPLAMLGLGTGDAKVVRNPGARVTPEAKEAMVLGVNLLGVTRILVIAHTRCAMASSSQAELRQRVGDSAGVDASWHTFGVVPDQEAQLLDDVQILRAHPLVLDSVSVGGFLYDVDTGRLERKA